MIKRQKPQNHSIFYKMLKIVTFIITIVLAIYIASRFRSNLVWNRSELFTAMSEVIIGQSEALNQLESAIGSFHISKGPHLIVISGGVGVGKSLSVNMILKSFPWFDQAIITTVKDLPYKSLQKVTSTTGENLLIIEDYNIQNYVPTLDLIDYLFARVRKLNVKLVVIFVYTNFRDDLNEFIGKISKSFIFEHIHFKPMSRESIELCFRREIDVKKVTINENALESAIDEHVKRECGCKNIATALIDAYEPSTIQ